MLSKLILDFGNFPNQKTHESEGAGFLVQALPVVQNQLQLSSTDSMKLFLGICVAFVHRQKFSFALFFRLECSVLALFFGQNLRRKSSDFIYFALFT